MSDDKKIRNAAVWGLCFIASAIFFLTEPTISNLSSSFMMRFLLLEFAIILFYFSFIAHIHGFVSLGRKLKAPFLERTALATLTAAAFLGLSITTSVFFGAAHDNELRTLTDGFTGFFFISFVAAALLFGIAVARLNGELGTLAICSAPIGLSIVFMWQPWPAIFLALPSIILLFRAAASNRYMNTPVN